MRRSTLLTLAVFVLGLAACAKQQLKTTYDKQATYIESFVSTRMKADTNATLVRNGGAYRLTLHDTLDRRNPRTDSLEYGGSVGLYYACYTLTSANVSSGNLISTNLEALAQSAGWKVTDTTLFKLDTLRLKTTLVEGLRLGLHGVQPGDEAFILFTGEYAFESAQGMIPARTALVYQVWIANIDNE